MKLSDFSGVIFDMDGLVLDTEATYFIAWQQAATQLGCTLSDSFCQSLSGLSGVDVKEKLLVECGADFDLANFNQIAGTIWRNHVHRYGIEVKRGFHELLAFIIEQSLPYCLATNSRMVNTLECLALADLEHVFSTIISRDQVAHGKPAPDIFLTAAETLQVPIQQCLVLEDSHAGIVSAIEAGAFAVFIPSTTPINPATLELSTIMMPDLTAVLESLRA